MISLVARFMDEQANCSHLVTYISAPGQPTSFFASPDNCPHCLRHRIGMLEEMLSQVMAFGIEEAEEEEDEDFRDDLLADIDAILKRDGIKA
jgi:hypothetical protein